MRWIALALLLVLPTAAAAVFPGVSSLSVEHSDSGRITASATHDYDDWDRSFALEIDFSRVGVYQVSRVDTGGPDAFFGAGEEYREAFGTLKVTLDDQGVASSLDCTLSVNETRPASMGILEYEGAIVAQAGLGMLDDDAWECQYGGNEVVHSGPANVPLSSFALSGVEGIDAGTFPADLAVLLGFADEGEEWPARYEELHVAYQIVRSGYVEAEPTLGEQTIPYSRHYASEDDGGLASAIVCGETGVTDTPATAFACDIDGEATLTLTQGSSSAAAATPAASAAADAPAGKEAPAAPLVALLAGIAVLSLAMRRRDA